ncbi:MAG: hypothetical protein HFE81_04710 [Bacilli bacterium]|nr:hypothetical protein [Bacilli bacterium]
MSMSIEELRRRQLFDLLRSLVSVYGYLLSNEDLKFIADIENNGIKNNL